MASTVNEIQWLGCLLKDLHMNFEVSVILWCDNKAALHIAANPVFHERTKHIDIDCHIVRQKYLQGFIVPSYVPSHDQLAGAFTKSLGKAQFQYLMSKLGLTDIHQLPT